MGCNAISQIVYRHNRHHEFWPFVIEDLKRLAQCSVTLEDEAQASAYKNRLLEEPPFDQLPPNLHTQLTLQQQLKGLERKLVRNVCQQTLGHLIDPNEPEEG